MAITDAAKRGGEVSKNIVKDNFPRDIESTSLAKNDMMTPKDTGLADKAPYAKGGMS